MENHRWKEVEVDGQRFTIKAWTVKDKVNYLAWLKDTQPSASPTIEEAGAIYQKQNEFLAGQLGKPYEEVEQMDSVLCEKLFAAVLRENSAPKGLWQT